jgi:hypothetical protein
MRVALLIIFQSELIRAIFERGKRAMAKAAKKAKKTAKKTKKAAKKKR